MGFFIMLATTLVGYRAVEGTLISVLSLYKDFNGT